MKKPNFNFKKGFSMAEVVISATVLIIMVVAIFFVLSKSMSHSMDSRDRIIATELAQEGIELARNIRDNSSAPAVAADGCSIAYNEGLNCSSSPRYVLRYKDGFYDNGATGDITKFARKITIVDYPLSGTPVGKKITSFVVWDGKEIFPSLCNVSNKCTYIENVLKNENQY